MSVFDFDLEPGEWYVFITCHHCAHTHVLFPDLTKGKSEVKGYYVWTCPDCNHTGDYEAEELERREYVPGDGKRKRPKSS